MLSSLRITMVSALALGASAQAVMAQVNVPNTARPEIVDRQLRLDAPRPEVGGAPIISSDDTGSKPISGSATFVLKQIVLEDATVFDEKTLAALYEDKLGKSITLDELNQIADSITRKYRNEGYILTRAVVPPQRIRGGVVRIRLVEGFVNEVRLEGDKVENDTLIRAYADKIKASRPLDAKTLERYLLLMEDLPGVEARAVLAPAANTPGASDVVITIRRKLMDFAASVDNRGSRFLGPVVAGGSAAANNVLGMNEQTQLRVANSVLDNDEMKYGELRHEQQLGTEGTTLVASLAHVETRPGHTLEISEVEGASTSAVLGLSHPLIRSRQSNWFVNSDFTWREVDVDTFGTGLYHDSTRVLTLGTSYDFVDSGAAVNRLEASGAKGFGTSRDSGEPYSRANAKTSFLKLNARASRLQPLMGSWSLMGSASGQYALDPLTAAEEFAVGGAEFGSAFDAAEISGDSGLAARGELQFNRATEWTYLPQYQLYGFYDVGRVWNRDIVAASEAAELTLASTGLGARFNISDSVSGNLEGAVPLNRKVASMGEDGSAPRIFFGLQYRY